MPREKKYIGGIIEKIYRRKFEDIGMYFWVESIRSAVPAVTIEEAIYRFFKYLCIEDFNIESAMSTYSKMKREYYEAAKKDIRGTKKA